MKKQKKDFGIRLIFVLGIVPLFFSCENPSHRSEVYVAAYRSLDRLIPYPFILKRKQDSIGLYNNEGTSLDMIYHGPIDLGDTLDIAGKVLYIQGKSDTHLDVLDLADSVRFRRYNDGSSIEKDRVRFEKLSHHGSVLSNDLANHLEGKTWVYAVEEDENSTQNRDLNKTQWLHFKRDSLYIFTGYAYEDQEIAQEYDVVGYSTFCLEGHCFLTWKKGTENPQPIFQIQALDNTTMDWVDFSSRKVKVRHYEKMDSNEEWLSDMLNKAEPYSKCFDGFQGEYYYRDDVTYNQGNDYIKEVVNDDLPHVGSYSGYIIVHFNVNCKGSLGNYGLIQMDERFNSYTFPKALVRHLFKKVGGLKDWPSTTSAIEWLYYEDVHAFLMFKIKDGKVTEVLP